MGTKLLFLSGTGTRVLFLSGTGTRLQLQTSARAATPSKVHWTLGYPLFTLVGLDGSRYYEVKRGAEMDWTTSGWTLVGHVSLRFGLRSNSRFIDSCHTTKRFHLVPSDSKICSVALLATKLCSHGYQSVCHFYFSNYKPI